MARRILKLPSWTPVTAGNDTSLDLPVGGNTYERILIEYSGVTLAQLKNLELRLNGDPVQRFTDGQQLEDLNDFYQRPKKAGFLTLWAIRPELTNIAQRRLTAWGTMNVQTLSVHLDVHEDATAPKLTAHAVISDPRPMEVITKIKQYPFSSAVSGKVEVDNVPRGPRIVAAHFFKSDISAIEVELDGRKFYEAAKGLGEAIQNENGRAPITGSCTHIDFLGDDDIGNALVTANARDMRFKPTLATAGNTDILVEYLDQVA